MKVDKVDTFMHSTLFKPSRSESFFFFFYIELECINERSLWIGELIFVDRLFDFKYYYMTERLSFFSLSVNNSLFSLAMSKVS